jgi:hypothetical protein
VRIRIALATAAAVIMIPAVLIALSSSHSASARVTGETATPQHTVRVGMKLMSYAQAQKVSKLATYAAAVTAAQAQQYLAEVAYVEANTMPAAWQATAMCEEGGRNDPYAGYFGILQWHHFDGYPTAGSAPLSVQLAWEAAHGQGPPDAPGRCHAY